MPLLLGQMRPSASKLGSSSRQGNGVSSKAHVALRRNHNKVGLGKSRAPLYLPVSYQARDVSQQVGFLESLTSKLKSQPAQPKKAGAKSVFVAGSTGRVGARVVRELLQQGYSVRAGCRKVETAQEAIDVAEAYGLLTADMIKRVKVVPFDLQDAESIREAIGGCQSVVCTVGAPENDALNPGAPKAIDGDGTISLIKEAAAAGVERFVLISSLGTGKVGWPASILNLFWGVLYWKREAEKALEASGMAYTILRPGGMERPTDSYKETHNLKLSPRDTTFGGQVSRLQVAELVGAVLNNPDLAANKILEVTAETTAPRLSLDELLKNAASEIKPDITPEQQQAAREASKDALAMLASGDKRLAAARADLEDAVDRLQAANRSLAEAKDLEAELKAKVAPTLKEGANVEASLNKARRELEAAVQAETSAKLVLEEARKVATSQNNQALSPQQLKAIREQVANQQRAAATAKKQEKEAAKEAAKPKAPPALPIPGLAPKPAEPPAPKAAAPKVAPQAAAPAPRAAPTPAPAAPKQQPAQPPNFFAKLFGGGDTIDKDVGAESDSQKIRVPQKGEEGQQPPVPVPKAAPAAPQTTPKVAPAAAGPPPVQPPRPVPSGPPKPSVPVENAEEVERRMLETLAEERRAKAMAEAKARMDKEAKAIEAAKAAMAKANPSPPPPPPPAKKAAPAPQTAAPKAAPKTPTASSTAPEGSAEANKYEAQLWIANWQRKQQGGGAAAQPSSNGKPAAPAAPSAGPSSSSQALPNKKEAQQGKAPAGGAAPAPPSNNGAPSSGPVAVNKKDAQEWIARWQQKQAADKK